MPVEVSHRFGAASQRGGRNPEHKSTDDFRPGQRKAIEELLQERLRLSNVLVGIKCLVYF